MNNCNECLYAHDGICQNTACSFDIEDNCYEFQSKSTYDMGYKQGRAEAFDKAIEYFIEHAHEVYAHVSARDFICDSLEQLKEQICI